VYILGIVLKGFIICSNTDDIFFTELLQIVNKSRCLYCILWAHFVIKCDILQFIHKDLKIFKQCFYYYIFLWRTINLNIKQREDI